MDIFNSKRVRDLETRLRDAEIDRDRYRHEINRLNALVEEMGKLSDSTPADCVGGEWCKACEFVRTFHHKEYFISGGYNLKLAYVCGKGVSCNNFVQKEE